MNKRHLLPVLLGSILVVGLALLLFGVTSNDEAANNDSSQVDPNQTSYLTYSDELVQQANTKKVVLFFNASWCPTCRIADQNFTTQANQGNFPDDLVILNVDYDDHRTLRQRHNVTGQHTFVQVDELGQELKTWGGSFTLSQVIDQL